jgi:hypothetical protein
MSFSIRESKFLGIFPSIFLGANPDVDLRAVCFALVLVVDNIRKQLKIVELSFALAKHSFLVPINHN